MTKSRSELEEMTKDELVYYADDMDIEVHHSWLKEDIVSEILKGQKAAAKNEDKPAAQSADQPAEQPAEQAEQQADVQYQTVDPQLAAQQEQTQKLPDEATRFASGNTGDETETKEK